MVFFNCGECGESLKKNQVEKHYTFQCRNCQVLSCVDCQKEFWGDAYKEHVKCFTEDEKYGGKNYKPKANANKGERKQEAWTEQVQNAIEKANTDHRLKNLLIQIKGYTNIPRKKAKFENFLKNSVRVHDSTLITRAWDLIQAQVTQQLEANNNSQQSNGENGSGSQPVNGSNESQDDQDKKLNKREKKEERKKKLSKKEKKDEKAAEEEDKPKKRKRKLTEDDDVEEEKEDSIGKKKKHKKHKKNGEEEAESQPKKTKRDSDEGEEDDVREVEEEAVPPVGKFNWEAVIITLLKAADDKEISLKRLRKKVMAEFWSRGGDGKQITEEKALGKFNKKISKNPRFKINKDRVKLLS